MRLLIIATTLCLYLIDFAVTPGQAININYGRARSQAQGKNGHHSVSDVETYGYHAGIRHADGRYQTLQQHTGSRSGGYATGPGAPQTWANGGTVLGPGGSRGGVGAGFRGGQGRATAHHVSQQYAIQLDNKGTTLYHNLPTKKKLEETKEDWE